MHFTHLKIIGFKSFADPVDVTIPVGLTGVIGPNGCGKSNLVEAMRWVMGESSSKAMRAGDMDDVIFAGSGNRSSRSFAEVIITLDNEDRSAPAIFNHDPVLEISRKLVRESGSTYRVNGREARARDVQLLFADAATGARSPSMVRQGQISELIMAKPSARRRILEDAAGISGLAARRHEAELRLNAAEANLEKLQLTLQGLEQQQNALQKQAREAGKYRRLTHEIQSLEVRIAYRQLEEADTTAQQVNVLLMQAQNAFQQAEAQEVEANTAVAIAAHTSIHMREKLETASHQLQELKAAQKLLTVEIERMTERSAGVDGQRARIDEDMTREHARLQEALQQLLALEKEQADVQAQLPMDAIAVQMAKENLTQAEDARHKAEQAKLAAANDLMQAKTQRDMAAQLLAEAQANCHTFEARHTQAMQELTQLQAQNFDTGNMPQLKATQAELQAQIKSIQTEISKLEQQFQATQAAALSAREEVAKTQQLYRSLLMEQASLQVLLKPAQTEQFEPINGQLQVDAGFETATAAALQDELNASFDAKAPAFFQGAQPQSNDAELPAGAISLATHVRGADVLMRRLQQIGVVQSLEHYTPEQLHTGQKLVTHTGQILRWDGLRISGAKAEAQAHYFTQKNRLSEVDGLIPNALTEMRRSEAALTNTQSELQKQEQNLKATRAQLVDLQTQFNATEIALRKAEQQQSTVQIALANKSAQIEQLKNALSDAHAQLATREAAIAQIDLPDDLAQALQAASAAFTIAQSAAQTARSAHEQSLRETDSRAYRAQQLGKDLITAQKRRDEAEWAIQRLNERLKILDEEHARLAVTSVDVMHKRQHQLVQEIANAQANLHTAQANFTSAEIDVKAREQAVKVLATQTLAVRESMVRLEVQAEAAEQALQAARMNVKALLETHHMTPEQMELQVGGAAQKSASDLAEQLERTKRDRERLGAVNLIAENELNEIAAKFEALNADQADLTAAIAQFRGAIASLNTEGRARLNKAFDAVNAHFVRLFTTLFEGGEAELIRTNPDDPLETGLEIIARPPGKKPQTLSLLSGGEQALTAMALIFAVFLSNPSPICVLDEVDAPLDDSNVERFCKLLDEMKRQTSTRFMIITHNPITMAHMDQLYGVTMAERGVSQVVSVQLREAVELSQVA